MFWFPKVIPWNTILSERNSPRNEANSQLTYFIFLQKNVTIMLGFGHDSLALDVRVASIGYSCFGEKRFQK